VLLAGVRADLLEAIRRLRFAPWYREDRIFPQVDDEADTATLKAVRRAYDIAGTQADCPHCAGTIAQSTNNGRGCAGVAPGA